MSPELLIQKQQVIQRTGPTDEERYVNTLTNAGTTRAVWDAHYIDDATFLGVNIYRGIHQELADRLTLAETYLRGEYPGRTDAQTATEIGLNTLSGKRTESGFYLLDLSPVKQNPKLSCHAFPDSWSSNPGRIP